MGVVDVGEPSPRFRRVAHDGKVIEVDGGRRDSVLVLYFYPRDETPGCTVQACGFRDHFVEFVEAGATVVGVSADSIESHRRFAEHHKLPFSLIADPDQSLRGLFGVPRTLGVVPGRVTFVIDRDNTIALQFHSLLRARRHVDAALQTVRRLTAD